MKVEILIYAYLAVCAAMIIFNIVCIFVFRKKDKNIEKRSIDFTDGIEEQLGKETIDLYNETVTKGNQESHGQNYQKLGKDLMSMDEIAVMDGGKCLLQIRGVRPFLSKKYDITKHPNYKYLSDYDQKNAFNIEQFLSTRFKPDKDEAFINYEISADELARYSR